METGSSGLSLETALRAHTRRRDELRRPAAEPGALHCVACAHRCLIRPGRAGICRIRFNDRGALQVPWGWVAGGLAADPIEKKPFFHVRPGSRALSFGLLGCDMHCGYCQNWITSQAPRESSDPAKIVPMAPDQIASMASRHGCAAVVSTYNEPLISAEWAADVFDLCRERGMLTGMVSNGNGTAEALEFLAPRLDMVKIDLKSFQDRVYRRLGAVLDNVLETIRRVHDIGLWLEVVTLVVPGLNDSSGELGKIAEFLVAISPDIPWHVTAFHPDYRMTDRGATSPSHLLRAVDAGRRAGLRYVYTGNLPGRTGAESTVCPACETLLIERHGLTVLRRHLVEGACPTCGTPIPGLWASGDSGRSSSSHS
ncbi:MAG: AmmeMemoRadiSam system radical SAM enzyme [Acidobacteriota bacterium]|nr:AmmeMemoRadiSam system radical SAM enzyme [Acidobacteriota bacterium]MDQ7088461.1 AmmeMemoRadiSam system radical SAM enzyme [Acidobacteriota bacterium]